MFVDRLPTRDDRESRKALLSVATFWKPGLA